MIRRWMLAFDKSRHQIYASHNTTVPRGLVPEGGQHKAMALAPGKLPHEKQLLVSVDPCHSEHRRTTASGESSYQL